MAYRWILGSWRTGEISLATQLPVVRSGNTFSRDIHAEEEGTLSISKRDLPDPSSWKEYLAPGEKFVALVDDGKSWDEPGAVLFAGPIIRTSGKVKDLIQIKVAGVKEYLSRRYVSSIFSGADSDPSAGVDFKASSFQGAMINAIKHAFQPTPGATVVPPDVAAPFPSVGAGASGISIKNSDFMSYSQGLEELANDSPLGNEFRFVWGWTSSERAAVKFTLEVAPDDQPQINSGSTISITLDGTSYKLVGYDEVSSLDGYATRLAMQSKAGDEEAGNGSDYTARVVSGPKVLWDETFNPGVELEPSEFEAQISQRLAFMSTLQGTASLRVVGDPAVWMANLGAQINITGGTNIDSSGYSISVRIVSVKIEPGTESVEISVMPLQARYPKLPKRDRLFGGSSGSSGNRGPSGSNLNRPISPRPPANKPLPSGGGSTPIIPPFQLPSYAEESAFGDWTFRGFQTDPTSLPCISGITMVQDPRDNSRIFGMDAYSHVSWNTNYGSSSILPPRAVQIRQLAIPNGTSWNNWATVPASVFAAEAFNETDISAGQHLVIGSAWYPVISGGKFFIFILHTIVTGVGEFGIWSWAFKTRSAVYSTSVDSPGSWAKEPWDLSTGDGNTYFCPTATVAYGRNLDKIIMGGGYLFPEEDVRVGWNKWRPTYAANWWENRIYTKKVSDSSWSTQSTYNIIDPGVVAGLPELNEATDALYPSPMILGGHRAGLVAHTLIAPETGNLEAFRLSATDDAGVPSAFWRAPAQGWQPNQLQIPIMKPFIKEDNVLVIRQPNATTGTDPAVYRSKLGFSDVVRSLITSPDIPYDSSIGHSNDPGNGFYARYINSPPTNTFIIFGDTNVWADTYNEQFVGAQVFRLADGNPCWVACFNNGSFGGWTTNIWTAKLDFE